MRLDSGKIIQTNTSPHTIQLPWQQFVENTHSERRYLQMGPKSTETGPRPSDTWTNNAFGPPWEMTFLETFIANLFLQALATHANQLSGCNNATVSTSPYCRGQENVVLEISFDDKEY